MDYRKSILHTQKTNTYNMSKEEWPVLSASTTKISNNWNKHNSLKLVEQEQEPEIKESPEEKKLKADKKKLKADKKKEKWQKRQQTKETILWEPLQTRPGTQTPMVNIGIRGKLTDDGVPCTVAGFVDQYRGQCYFSEMSTDYRENYFKQQSKNHKLTINEHAIDLFVAGKLDDTPRGDDIHNIRDTNGLGNKHSFVLQNLFGNPE